MKTTTVICALAVLAALIFIVYTFMIEGFITTMEDAKATGYMKGNADTICMAFGDGTTGDCAKCLDADETNHFGTQCGYWPQGSACIPRSGVYRLIPDWLTVKQNTDKTYPQTFDPKDFVYNVGKCGGAACASFKTCKACAGASACGWCDSTNTCMDRTAVAANVDAIAKAGSMGSMMGSPPQPLCPPMSSTGEPAITSAGMLSMDSSSKALILEVGTCRPEVCGDKETCFDCTNTSGCGFCKTTGKCIKVDSAGNAGSSGSLSGSAICATGQVLLQSYMCPCSGITNCKTCSTQPGCGWCVAGKNCVNVDSLSTARDSEITIGGVNVKDCAAGGNGVATSASQCAPGAKLGNTRSERGKYKPGADELNLIQDNAADSDSGFDLDITGSIGAGVIGSKPVSAATTTKEVTGNGVVTIPRATGGPYTFTNQPNLFTSPFEEYVKVLIRSEMANGGIPSNEPFQDSPTIVDYATKEVKKVIRKNF
jgi:hypothetical protein